MSKFAQNYIEQKLLHASTADNLKYERIRQKYVRTACAVSPDYTYTFLKNTRYEWYDEDKRAEIDSCYLYYYEELAPLITGMRAAPRAAGNRAAAETRVVRALRRLPKHEFKMIEKDIKGGLVSTEDKWVLCESYIHVVDELLKRIDDEAVDALFYWHSAFRKKRK